MNSLTIGQRLPLSKIDVSESSIIKLAFTLQSTIEMDISCFALDATGRLISDEYMIFYNQYLSPCGNIKNTHYLQSVSGDKGLVTDFEVCLSKLSENIDSLFFVLSSDSSLAQLGNLKVVISQGSKKAKAQYLPENFGQQQASMLIQFYRKGGVWRIANVAQGFNGGLAQIVRHFGGEVEEDASASIQDASNINTTKVSLEKIMTEKAPKLINLAKKATISLEKHKLQNLTAKVALVLDASGSMNGQYKKGHVQEVVNRLLPIGVSFDDDQSLDCWAFGDKCHYLGDIEFNNYEDFIEKAHGGWRKWDCGSRTNNETSAIEAVSSFYKKEGVDVPVYVLFISDGGVTNTNGITNAITNAAKLPIFWQFVGIGGSSYGVLKNLDDMTGRLIDNCSFFEINHINSLSEEQLYENMLEEFPSWIKEAKGIGLLNS
ncbi:MAG: VWA domain-containing protein [Psychrobacter sp.]|nr:VWA domain-containing protein [Psychrobacter sp.]